MPIWGGGTRAGAILSILHSDSPHNTGAMHCQSVPFAPLCFYIEDIVLDISGKGGSQLAPPGTRYRGEPFR